MGNWLSYMGAGCRKPLDDPRSDLPWNLEESSKKSKRHFVLPENVISEGNASYYCTKCGGRFRSKYNSKNHVNCGTETPKPFQCHECGLCFNRKSQLKCHQISHSDERPFSCLQCGFAFKTTGNLKRHERVVHRDRTVGYECGECYLEFTSQWALDKHLRSVHYPGYPCSHCDMTFQVSKDLKRHFVTHTGVKAFKCVLCGRQHSRKDNVIRHLLRVHKVDMDVGNYYADRGAFFVDH